MNETFAYRQHGQRIFELRRDYNEKSHSSEKSLTDFLRILLAKGILSAKDIQHVLYAIQDDYSDEISEKLDIYAEKVAKRLR
jgi:hypothetical protein